MADTMRANALHLGGNLKFGPWKSHHFGSYALLLVVGELVRSWDSPIGVEVAVGWQSCVGAACLIYCKCCNCNCVLV